MPSETEGSGSVTSAVRRIHTPPEGSFRVSEHEAGRFLAATNGGAPGNGRVVPPFLVAALSLRTALGELLPRLAADAHGVVHVQHHLSWRRQVPLGAVLVARAEPTSLRSTSLGTVATVDVTTQTGGVTVLDQRATILLLGATGGTTTRRPPSEREAPSRTEPEPFATVSVPVDPDQAERYAVAAQDHNPVHTDDAAARAVGLPGVVLHGMCTLALVGQVVVSSGAGGETAHLCALGARFGEPVVPGTEMVVRLWRAGKDRDARHVVIDVRDAAGSRILRRGFGAVT